MTHSLVANSLSLGYGTKTIASQINLSFDKPEIVAIIGPNGSGKSTVLKALSRLLPPTAGQVLLDGKNIHLSPRSQVAQILSIMPQETKAPDDLLVYDLVACGRTPYRKFFNDLSSADKEIIEESLQAAGLLSFSYRRLDTLSGGERQRAWLAMALAQKPHILMLDEPTTYLDIHHQLELMQLISRLHEQLQLTVIMVLHDLNQAARFCQRLIAIKDGRVFADGSVTEVLTSDTLRELYGVETIVTTITREGRKYLVCLPHDVCG